MSLFRARDWWSTTCGSGENFDSGCMAVGNVDNDLTGSAKIVVGSFHGILRIYNPHGQGYNPDDLVLEKQLESPVLQVAIGRFLPSLPGQLALALLHPRSLAVYSVVTSAQGLTSVSLSYEHTLQRAACNFIFGPFGGVMNKDYFCVQSLDGMLTFFEQDAMAFSRFLGNFLMPGPLAYVVRTDSILTMNSQMELESYRYHALASSATTSSQIGVSAIEADRKDASSVQSGKKLAADWTFNVGEHGVQLAVTKLSRGVSLPQAEIVVLAERSIVILRDNGEIKSQKLLDYFPSCMCPYAVSESTNSGSGGLHNLLIASHGGVLLVNTDQKVIWSAKLQSVPVDVAVATFANQSGLIATLDETGHLSIAYLGTDPATDPPVVVEAKELDYEEMDKEHRRLQAVVKNAVQATPAATKPVLMLKAQPPSVSVDIVDAGSEYALAGGDLEAIVRIANVRVFLSYSGQQGLENVVLSFLLPFPLSTVEESISIPSIPGGSSTPLVFPVQIRASKLGIPRTLKIRIRASYNLPSGEPQTSECSVDLPIVMAGTFVQPSKNAQLKLTVETDRDAVPLQELFEDIAKNDEEASRFISSNVLTFQYFNQEDCSILVSKQGGRYRIQSSSLPALWLLTEDLCSRIHRHFKKKTEKCKLIFEEPLPMQEYFEIVDAHFNLRCAYREQELMLSQLTHQFRAIEKRLLVRFKDRNPAPLNSFDLLFESTYAEIQSLADAMSANRKRLVAMGNKLSCVTALVLLLAKLRFAIPEEDYQVLVTALSPDVDDISEQGWEETVDAAMTHLLRTYLAKNAREAGSVAQSITFPTDTSRLKKHIALVIDRVGKGGKLSPREPTADASKPKLSSGRGSRGRPSASVAAKQSQENVTED